MVSVIVHNNFGAGGSGIDQALKSLQRKIQKEAIVRELKASRYHEKPSEKRKRKGEEAARRRKKINKKMRMDVSYRNFVLFTEQEEGIVETPVTEPVNNNITIVGHRGGNKE